MSKSWKYHPEQCDFCGSDSEIYTYDNEKEGWGWDGDEMRCTECGAKGYWSVYEEDDAYCNWIDPTRTNG